MSSTPDTPESAPSARTLANRKNAQKSTGPKAGKARSRLNACKHGLTSEALILPGEDPAAYQAQLDRWVDFYRPQSPVEVVLVERVVRASWMLDRCTRAEDAVLSTRIRHAADEFRRAAHDEADILGRRLIEDDVNYRNYIDARSQMTDDLIERRRRDDPPALARKLCSFAAGADWLIARWREFEATLDEVKHWHYSEAHRAIRLLGRRPVDVFDDSLVRRIMAGANAADPRTSGLEVQVQRVFGQTHNAPDTYERLQDAATESLTPEDGLAILRRVVSIELSRLETLKRTQLDPLARLDEQAATYRAAFDDSNAGTLRHRYEVSRERALHRALADLKQSIKENPRVEETPSEEQDATPEPESTSAMASFRQVESKPPTAPPKEAPPQPETPLPTRPNQPIRPFGPEMGRSGVSFLASVTVGRAMP